MLSRTAGWALAVAIGAAAALGGVQDENTAQPPQVEGRKVLETACTTCHDLKEVEKFKGFWKREDWQDIVTTMVEYGAEVKEAEVAPLVDYLTRVYGVDTK